MARDSFNQLDISNFTLRFQNSGEGVWFGQNKNKSGLSTGLDLINVKTKAMGQAGAVEESDEIRQIIGQSSTQNSL